MDHDNEFTNFAERLAENGYTYPLTKSVVHLGINAGTSKAKKAHRGMFSLPDEVFESLFRPWEVQQHWEGKGAPLPEVYQRYYPIGNVDGSAQPQEKWCSGDISDE